MGLLVSVGVGVGARGRGRGGGNSRTPLFFKNEDEELLTVSFAKSNADAPTVSLEVSTDGKTWTEWGDSSTTALTAEVPVGGNLYVRGNNAAYGNSNNSYANMFSFSGPVSLHGNIESLTGDAEAADISYRFKNMFKNCTSITDVDIVTDGYSEGMFYGCTALARVKFSKRATEIGKESFRGCTALTAAAVPGGVTAMGEGVFRGCSALGEVSLPAAVTLGTYAFTGCSSLNKVSYGGTLSQWCGKTKNSTFSHNYDLYIGGEKVTALTIPADVTNLPSEAFAHCNITSVTIPSTVTTCGMSAFAYSGVQSAVVSASIGSIPDSMFEGSSLVSIEMASGITTIYDSAFLECASLTTVSMPNTVEEIGITAFRGCTSLTTMNISSSLNMLRKGAFSKSGLKSIKLPNALTSIPSMVCEECTDLARVDVGERVTDIGSSAFAGCASLGDFTCRAADPPVLDSSAFSNTGRLAIYVPEGQEEVYRETSGWSDYAQYIEPIQE